MLTGTLKMERLIKDYNNVRAGVPIQRNTRASTLADRPLAINDVSGYGNKSGLFHEVETHPLIMASFTFRGISEADFRAGVNTALDIVLPRPIDNVKAVYLTKIHMTGLESAVSEFSDSSLMFLDFNLSESGSSSLATTIQHYQNFDTTSQQHVLPLEWNAGDTITVHYEEPYLLANYPRSRKFDGLALDTTGLNGIKVPYGYCTLWLKILTEVW
jgi:hypothetical protein